MRGEGRQLQRPDGADAERRTTDGASGFRFVVREREEKGERQKRQKDMLFLVVLKALLGYCLDFSVFLFPPQTHGLMVPQIHVKPRTLPLKTPEQSKTPFHAVPDKPLSLTDRSCGGFSWMTFQLQTTEITFLGTPTTILFRRVDLGSRCLRTTLHYPDRFGKVLGLPRVFARSQPAIWASSSAAHRRPRSGRSAPGVPRSGRSALRMRSRVRKRALPVHEWS